MAVLAVALVLLVSRTSAPDQPTQAATTPVDDTSATAPAGQEQQCANVAASFTGAFFDKSLPVTEWRSTVKSWVSPDLRDDVNVIDRSRIPAGKATGMKVTAQPGSCDVSITTTVGDFPVVVEDTPNGWLVTSWG